ncbi:MAG: LPS export ABC transporter permease LptF [Betaproteobacteria bacterium]|nr:LPS export ABC transporter permease LptF [Betaproteobacteria bacterium]
MSIFHRSLVREILGVGGAVGLVLLLIILTRLLIRFLGDAAGGVVEAEAVLALMGFSLISYLPVVLCLAVFIAVLLTLSRSYRDSEMQVWFSSGLSLLAWIRPVLRVAFPVALAVGMMSLFLTPWTLAQSQSYLSRLKSKDDVSRVTPGTFYESKGTQRVAFVDATSDAESKVNNVFVESKRQDTVSVVVAERGLQRTEANGDRFLVLEKGRQYEGVPGTVEYQIVDFDTYSMRIDSKEPVQESPSTRAMSVMDLWKSASAESFAEFHWRMALPIVTLLLALAAIPLSFVNPRSGRSWNLLIAILVFVLYYNTLNIFQLWTAKERIPAWLGMWPVHGAMLLILAGLFSRQILALRWLVFSRR